MGKIEKVRERRKEDKIYIYLYDFITELPSQITPARNGKERKEVLLPSLRVWIDAIAQDDLNPILRASAARS